MAGIETFGIPETFEARGIVHGFFTRLGGVSQGLYASLNCGPGSNDSADAVRENRHRAAQRLGVASARLCTLHQVHGSSVITVEAAWRHEERPRADALVTRQAGFALGVLTADCAPVLFADPVAGVIGAAHAGWQGAFGGVLEATVDAMERQGATRKNIAALVGPAIAQDSYEVGPEFFERFVAASVENAAFFQPSSRMGHHLFDLVGFVRARLEGARLGRIAALGVDTYADERRCFSYRRATHWREGDYGRLLSAIALAK